MGVHTRQQYAEQLGESVCPTINFQQLAYQLNMPIRVIIDGEGCFQWLAGGFMSDDACGGQWFRMFNNIRRIYDTFNNNRPFPVHIVVAFDGQVGDKGFLEWKEEQLGVRSQIELTLKHIDKRATPPPKIWTYPPVGAKLCVIQALRQIGVQVCISVEDYGREVAEFWTSRGFDVLIGYSGEFFAFNPRRYICGRSLRIDAMKGCVTSKEFLTKELCVRLNVPIARLALLVSLLGNSMLSDEQMADFHDRVLLRMEKNDSSDADRKENEASKEEDASADGGSKPGSRPEKALVPAVAAFVARTSGLEIEEVAKEVFGSNEDPRARALLNAVNYYELDGRDWTVANVRFPADAGTGKEEHRENGLDEEKENPGNVAIVAPFGIAELVPKLPKECGPAMVPPILLEVMAEARSLHNRGMMSTYVLQVLSKGEVRIPVLVEVAAHNDLPNIGLLFRDLRRCVYAVLYNYHHHQYNFKRREIDVGMLKGGNLEGQRRPDSRNAGSSLRPRAIPEMKVKEWVWSAVNPYKEAELVEPENMGWQVPTLRRLWFGTNARDAEVRMQVFLACMRSETLECLVPGWLGVIPYPRQAFVMACVLRYLLTACPAPVLSLFEVKAAVATVLSKHLCNRDYLKDLEAPRITVRSVQVAAAITFGIEMAFFADSACGAPVLAGDICPWMMFDGKLFQSKLAQVQGGVLLIDLCDGNRDACNAMDIMLQQLSRGIVWGANGSGAALGLPLGAFPFQGNASVAVATMVPPVRPPLIPAAGNALNGTSVARAFPYGAAPQRAPAERFQQGHGFGKKQIPSNGSHHGAGGTLGQRNGNRPTENGRGHHGAGGILGQWNGNQPSVNGRGHHGAGGIHGQWNGNRPAENGRGHRGAGGIHGQWNGNRPTENGRGHHGAGGIHGQWNGNQPNVNGRGHHGAGGIHGQWNGNQPNVNGHGHHGAGGILGQWNGNCPTENGRGHHGAGGILGQWNGNRPTENGRGHHGAGGILGQWNGNRPNVNGRGRHGAGGILGQWNGIPPTVNGHGHQRILEKGRQYERYQVQGATGGRHQNQYWKGRYDEKFRPVNGYGKKDSVGDFNGAAKSIKPLSGKVGVNEGARLDEKKEDEKLEGSNVEQENGETHAERATADGH